MRWLVGTLGLCLKQGIDLYRGADKSLARPGRKQATATEDLMFVYPIYYHNWRNISTIDTHTHTHIYIYRVSQEERT